MLLHFTTVLYYYYAIPSTLHQIEQIKSRLQLVREHKDQIRTHVQDQCWRVSLKLISTKT